MTQTGTLLRRARLAQGKTLKQVADAAGMYLTYLSDIEHGTKRTSPKLLLVLGPILGIDEKQLRDAYWHDQMAAACGAPAGVAREEHQP